MRNASRIILACGLALAAAAASRARAHEHTPGLDTNGQCVGDADGNGVVAVNELITAVNNALGGCPERPVAIEFKGMVGDRPFACGQSYSGIGTGDSQFVPSDFRFYVSDVRLVTPGGTEVPVQLEQDGIWQYQNVALIDLENGAGACAAFGNEATNTTLRGTVPPGVYTGLTFNLGLPFDLNHGNAATAPSPLNFTAMFWNWQFGYKFVRVDTADDKFRIHLGSTGCVGEGPSRPPTSCSAPNVATVALGSFDITHDVVIADLKALLSQNDIDENAPNTDPGCMSSPTDADCGPLFNSFGLAFPAGTPISGQRFFRAGRPATDDGHREVFVASTEENGGALLLHPEFDTSEAIPASLSDCLGGSDDECTGGTQVFTTVNPGIEPLAESEPDESLYALAADTPVTLEITALDAGLTMRLGDTTLDRVGATVLLGSAPDFHADMQAQLALPTGTPTRSYSVSFKVTTTASGYESSSDLTLSFTPAEGSAHHN
ncbi:metallo-mystery pair system four-Cys motif protein [bacterium]|nr:metallo-mystery pair system four-Cys motif protein [bacterium]